MKMFDATEVVPINFVFYTASAIIAGINIELKKGDGLYFVLNEAHSEYCSGLKL